MLRTKTISRTVAVVLLLAGSPALADDGYRQDYDYPDQGDDWYGGSAAPDPRRDFPPLDVDAAYDGDDFGFGYERVFDPLGFGPPVDLTRARHTAYEFRFGGAPFAAPECADDGECGSPSWCNGTPLCLVGFCQPGQGHSCNDNDPCTSDSCNEAQQRCDYTPVPPIGETVGLMMSRATDSAVATLYWDDRPDEDYYHVYRGQDAALGDLVCYAPEVYGTTLDDDGTVPPGGIYVHLVSAVDQCGEGTIGEDSDGYPRVPAGACP